MGYNPGARRRRVPLRDSWIRLSSEALALATVPCNQFHAVWNSEGTRRSRTPPSLQHVADLLLKTGIPRQQAELEAIVLSGLFGREDTGKDEAFTHLVFLGALEPHGAAKSYANRPVSELERSVRGNPEGAEASLAQTANRVGGEPKDFAIE